MVKTKEGEIHSKDGTRKQSLRRWEVRQRWLLSPRREEGRRPAQVGWGGTSMDPPSKTKQLHLSHCQVNSYNYRPSPLIMAAWVSPHFFFFFFFLKTGSVVRWACLTLQHKTFLCICLSFYRRRCPSSGVERPEREADQPPTCRLGLWVRPQGVGHSYALESPEQWPAYNLRLVLKARSINSSCYSYAIHYTVSIKFSMPAPRVYSEGIQSKTFDGKCCCTTAVPANTKLDSVCSPKFRREGDQTLSYLVVLCANVYRHGKLLTVWHSCWAFVSFWPAKKELEQLAVVLAA